MGFYLGGFYIEKRDIYYLLGLGLIILGYRQNYPLPYLRYGDLFVLAVLFFLTKGLVLPTYDSLVVVVFLIAVLLTIFFPFSQILFFLALAFLFLRLFRVM